MKLLGKLEQIVELVFRKGLYIFTLKPNQSTVFTANRTYELPPGDSNQELVSTSSSQELTGKTISGDGNTLSNISLSSIKVDADPSAINKVLVRNGSGAIVNSLISNIHVDASAAIEDTKLATISTSGKISNSATTADSFNTANAIVARNAFGNFSAGTITASLDGSITGTASNITASSNSTLTTLSSLSLPGSQVTGNISGNSSNVTGIVATSNGGTGVNSIAIFPSQGIIVTRNASETLLNKQISSTNLFTGALRLPAGTIAERPPSPNAGMVRYNTNTSLVEFYNGSTWNAAGGGGGGEAAAVEQVLVESGSYVSTYSTPTTGGNTAVGPNINLDANTTYEISISGVSIIGTSTFPITNVDFLNWVNTEIEFKNTSTNARISGSYLPVNAIERRQAGDYLTLSSQVGFNYKFRITPSTNITIRLYSNCFSSFAFNTNPLTHSLYAVRIGLTNFGLAPI